MPGKTSIEWCDASWNPVTGCTKVSAGCDHCYAETFAERWRGIPGHPYEQGFDLKLWPERLPIPLRWTKPRRIFVNSMSDVFHRGVPDAFIDQVWAVMMLAPAHTFLVLTKRPRRMQRYVSDPELYIRVLRAAAVLRVDRPALDGIAISDPRKWPAVNIWLGTSVENQDAAFRIDSLMQTPAMVRFLSCEPLLGSLDLDKWLWEWAGPAWAGRNPAPDLGWVIAGGESGPKARPMDPEWARRLRDQCTAAEVPFFFKQWGGSRPKSGGRELDGRTWDEFPEVRSA